MARVTSGRLGLRRKAYESDESEPMVLERRMTGWVKGSAPVRSMVTPPQVSHTWRRIPPPMLCATP